MYKNKEIRLAIGLILIALALGSCAKPTPELTVEPTEALPT